MATKLRLLREACGLSQWQLAREADISGSLLSLFERGRKRPGPELAGRIASLLKVDIEDIMEEVDHEESVADVD